MYDMATADKEKEQGKHDTVGLSPCQSLVTGAGRVSYL